MGETYNSLEWEHKLGQKKEKMMDNRLVVMKVLQLEKTWVGLLDCMRAPLSVELMDTVQDVGLDVLLVSCLVNSWVMLWVE